MDIRRTDHLHAGTPHWPESVISWPTVGFELGQEWRSGEHRAGRIESGDADTVLAEIARGTPASSVGFATDAPDTTADKPLDVVTPLSNTPWGSRGVRIENPTGRIHVLEKSQ